MERFFFSLFRYVFKNITKHLLHEKAPMNSFLQHFNKQIKRKPFSRITLTIISGCILLAPCILSAQNIKEVTPDSIKYFGVVYQKVTTKLTYPKVVGYLSFILPL